jgi:tyrosyl-tRNA synthetase
VLQVSELLFNPKAGRDALLALGERELATVAEEIPSFEVSREVLAAGINIVDLMSGATAIASSKGDAKRAVQGQAVTVNKEKIESPDALVQADTLLHGKYLLLENGKKNKFMIVAKPG